MSQLRMKKTMNDSNQLSCYSNVGSLQYNISHSSQQYNNIQNDVLPNITSQPLMSTNIHIGQLRPGGLQHNLNHHNVITIYKIIMYYQT